jgi:hypothetical protein
MVNLQVKMSCKFCDNTLQDVNKLYTWCSNCFSIHICKDINKGNKECINGWIECDEERLYMKDVSEKKMSLELDKLSKIRAYDNVVVYGLLNHCKDPKVLLHHLFAMTNKSLSIIVKKCYRIEQFIKKPFQTIHDNDNIWIINSDTIKNLMQQYGFVLCDISQTEDGDTLYKVQQYPESINTISEFMSEIELNIYDINTYIETQSRFQLHIFSLACKILQHSLLGYNVQINHKLEFILGEIGMKNHVFNNSQGKVLLVSTVQNNKQNGPADNIYLDAFTLKIEF